MKKFVMAVLASLLLLACGDGAEKIYETARFEEQQFNVDHATRLYRRIVADFPDSPYAVKAKERLRELEDQ